MKAFFRLCVFLLVAGIFTSSSFYFPIADCDVITMKNGKEIDVKVLEITTNVVKYKYCDYADGPIISVLREDVYSIKYPNGKKEVLPEIIPMDKSRKVDGLSVASMILGLSGVGLLSIIFGAIGLRRIKNNPKDLYGKGYAKAGIWLGIITTIILLLFFIF